MGHSNRYVFSGKIRCGECGAVFVGRFKTLNDGTRIRRWSCGTVVREGISSCAVGKLVRDDDGIKILKDALCSLQFDRDKVITHVTALIRHAAREGKGISPEIIRREITVTQQKKQAMLDSFFAGEISREDMLILKAKYESQIKNLRSRMQESHMPDWENKINELLCSILHGTTESPVFYKTILRDMTVYIDKHIELRMHDLPQIFHFSGE